MIGRKTLSKSRTDDVSPQSFDDFALRLGDTMRGERATLGKSLLDVQRELRIKASYIAAIENCDPSAFDTPGFIAGYVRSYARYLGMDPDEAFAGFCAESGFTVAHGMSDQASTIRKSSDDDSRPKVRDPFAEPSMAFAPKSESIWSRIEPGAVGSSLVLIGLIAGIGYGGWSVLQEVQRVQITPVDQTPAVLSQLDPVTAALQTRDPDSQDPANAAVAGVFTPPSGASFDRLYRPQALDVPVLVARDAPISTLDPSSVGVFAEMSRPGLPSVQDSSLAAVALAEGLVAAPGNTATPVSIAGSQGVMVVATDTVWVSVKDEGGRVLYTKTMQKGDTYAVPGDANQPQINIGQAGAVYFAVNGTPYGPAGRRGEYAEVALVSSDVTQRFDPATPGTDGELMAVMVELDLKARPAPAPKVRPPQVARAASPSPQILAQVAPQQLPQATPLTSNVPPAAPVPGNPQVTVTPLPGITIVATAETWVEVTAPSGKKLFATTMQPGDSYKVPQTEEPSVVFSGNAGGVFFAVNGQTYGPYGTSGQFGRNLALSPQDITQKLQVADLNSNQTLAKVVAELQGAALAPNR